MGIKKHLFIVGEKKMSLLAKLEKFESLIEKTAISKYDLNYNRMKQEILEFPHEFGMRAYPGDVFRVSIDSSYVNDSGKMMFYTQRKTEKGWSDFAKGDKHELMREVVPLNKLDATINDFCYKIEKLSELLKQLTNLKYPAVLVSKQYE